MYINSFCSISPAGVLVPGLSFASLEKAGSSRVACREPDYKELIPAMQLRRMTKPVRTGVAAARLCLQHEGKTQPDAIHVGTAYGMLQDSENFLQKMVVQEEQMLNPTAFIQSTHNTVAGQIALSMGCNAHNMTYVHKAHSFESAVLDAALMLEDYPDNTVLTGAVDECTDTSYNLLQRFGVYHEGNIAGEGAAFFSMSGTRQPGSLARLEAFDMFTASDTETLSTGISGFFQREGLAINADDLLLHGIPGPDLPEPWSAPAAIGYQQYCGTYPTAAAFALALGTLLLSEHTASRCWILNGFGRHYSIWLLHR